MLIRILYIYTTYIHHILLLTSSVIAAFAIAAAPQMVRLTRAEALKARGELYVTGPMPVLYAALTLAVFGDAARDILDPRFWSRRS